MGILKCMVVGKWWDHSSKSVRVRLNRWSGDVEVEMGPLYSGSCSSILSTVSISSVSTP